MSCRWLLHRGRIHSRRSGRCCLLCRKCFRPFGFFQLPDPLLHVFAGFKCDDELFRNVDTCSCPWIPRLAGGTFFHFEDTKVTQLDTTFAHERVDDGIEGLLYDFLRLQLGHPNLFGNRFDDIFFRHN